MRRTKLVCTLGPVTGTREGVRALAEAGADVLRVNLSHGEPEQHAELIGHVRAVADELGRELAVMTDLPGPKIRLGRVEPDPPVRPNAPRSRPAAHEQGARFPRAGGKRPRSSRASREAVEGDPGGDVAARRSRRGPALEALVDTNVLVRHLTGDPPAEARRATAFLAAGHVLLLADVILAELASVLSSYLPAASGGGRRRGPFAARDADDRRSRPAPAAPGGRARS